MIDVHIGLSGKENKKWLGQCTASLEREPVNIHFVRSVPGDIGKMRAIGYSAGTSPWVVAVDPDDWVEQGAFTRALEFLTDDVSAYYTNHSVFAEDGERTGQWFKQLAPAVGFAQASQMHHLTIYRREAIRPALHLLVGMPTRPYTVLNLQALLQGQVVGTKKIEYHWRDHPQGLHRNLAATVRPREQTLEWINDARNRLQSSPLNNLYGA
jgi:hypothetical protein